MRRVFAFAAAALIAGAAQAQTDLSTIRPVPRPESWPTFTKPLWIGGDGALCGEPKITGTRKAPVFDIFKGCGILNPVQVTKVADVFLSTPTLTDCPTAVALTNWVEQTVKPAIGDIGGGVAVIQIAGSYSCRPVNNQPGGSLSEHGRGRAIDVSGFRTFDGTWLTVAKDWTNGEKGIALQKIHASACGTFSTVLGPAFNSYHVDHFHLDTATRRGQAYCK